MSLIIASQMEPDFNRSLARHPSAPVLIDVAEDAPWSAADEADILLIRPSPAWRAPEVRRPAPWPGRLKWVYSASVGVDFYPDWLLDAPLVTCGRGVASEEIADYAIAAIYAHAKNLDAVTVRSRAQWGPAQLGRVSGTTIGIIGMGAIGAAVARRGLLVTELLGQGVNYVNGDYSRGAAGFWVEDGKIVHAVEEITIAGNLRDMFRHVASVGNDVLVRGSKQVGSLLIEQMKVAGN